MLSGPSSRESKVLPSTGKGERRVYLVYASAHQLLGVASTPDSAHRLGSKHGLPFRVVGPVPLNDSIDWDDITEEEFGVDSGPLRDWIDLKDGVPYVVPPLPLSYLEARAVPFHARGH